MAHYRIQRTLLKLCKRYHLNRASMLKPTTEANVDVLQST